MKKIKRIGLGILSCFMMLAFACIGSPIKAIELNKEADDPVIVDKFDGILKSPYVLDRHGNLITDMEMSIESVEVVYDGAWDGVSRVANVPRVINVTVVCKGTKYFSQSMYWSKLSVALELKYNTSTMKITSIGKPDLYYVFSPTLGGVASNANVSASITNGGKSVKINGSIHYSAGVEEDLRGSTTYYL